jgi:hypothetical protein
MRTSKKRFRFHKLNILALPGPIGAFNLSFILVRVYFKPETRNLKPEIRINTKKYFSDSFTGEFLIYFIEI